MKSSRVSVEMSQKIVQGVCKELYNHDVYMFPADQIAGESVGTEVQTEDEQNDKVSSSTYKNCTYIYFHLQE